MQMENDVPLMVEKMSKTFISDEDRFDYIGKLLNRSQTYEYSSISGKVKLSPNVVVKANELVYIDATSKSYKSNQEASVYDIYKVMLDEIASNFKKDPMTVWEKCYLTHQITSL